MDRVLRITTPFAAFLAVLLLAKPVSADWLVGAFAGVAHTADTWLRIRQPAVRTDVMFSEVRYDSASLEPPIYYGYRVGVFPRSKSFGVEGELIHLKVIAASSRPTRADGTIAGQRVDGLRPVSDALDSFSITHGVNLLLLNAVVRWPAESDDAAPRWMLIGRAGIGGSIPHAESRVRDVRLEHYEWGAASVQGSAGISVRIARSLYLSAEYKITRTVQEVAIVGGSARTPLRTHHLAAGLSARLGRRNPRKMGPKQPKRAVSALRHIALSGFLQPC